MSAHLIVDVVALYDDALLVEVLLQGPVLHVDHFLRVHVDLCTLVTNIEPTF